MLKYDNSYVIMDEPTAAAFPSWDNGHFREMLEEFILDSSNT